MTKMAAMPKYGDIYILGRGQMNKTAAMPIYGKILQNPYSEPLSRLP